MYEIVFSLSNYVEPDQIAPVGAIWPESWVYTICKYCYLPITAGQDTRYTDIRWM